MNVDSSLFKDWLEMLVWLGGAIWVALNIYGKLHGKREVPSQFCKSKFEQLEKSVAECKLAGFSKIAEVDSHYDSRVKGLKNSVDRGMDALRAELKDMRKELREDIQRMEERSSSGDAGLRDLSKDLVNAVSRIEKAFNERGK